MRTKELDVTRERSWRAVAGASDGGSFRWRAREPVSGYRKEGPSLPDSIPVPVPVHLRSRSNADADGPSEWPAGTPAAVSPHLREGSYFIRLTPVLPASEHGSRHYDGTMRVQADAASRFLLSGDLYLHELTGPALPQLGEPDPGCGIPIFPIKRYCYYLRAVGVRQTSPPAGSFELAFEMHRFDFGSATRDPAWRNEGVFTARMEPKMAPPGYPSSRDYYSGEVISGSGGEVGTLTMGWVSSYLRRAVIEIDKARDSEWPLDNGAGGDWRSIFAQAGWDVTVVQSDPAVTEPADGSWSDAEVHAAMLAWRDSADLDTQWRYHLLCVRLLDGERRGVMYDHRGYSNKGADANDMPREGAAISSHWEFWEDSFWGRCSGQRFGAAGVPYFRTAVHEIGHALCLYHPLSSRDNSLMQDTYQIACNAKPPRQFPDNVEWCHSPEDQRLLRHMPDIWVRPGGISFDWGLDHDPVCTDSPAVAVEGLDLEVYPLLDVVPIGAPVRVEYTLINNTGGPIPAPKSLDIKSGHVRGHVIDPSGTVRSYSTVVLSPDEGDLCVLDPEASLGHSLTLLRGAEGPLFPFPGYYRVGVELSWAADGMQISLDGETSVMIMPPVDEDHARAALKILSTPEALLTLAIGGDHIEGGIEAIQTGLSHKELHPHYAFVEAKRVGKRFRERGPDLDAAAGLIGEETVLSRAERKRAAALVRSAEEGRPSEAGDRILMALRGGTEVLC